MLGAGTDLIFAGVIGKQLPRGRRRTEQAADAAARPATTRLANIIVATARASPAWASTSPRSRMVLLGVIAIYLGASLFGWLQGYLLNGIVQRTVYKLRATSRTS